jgi:hypothetical protein
MDSMHDAIAVEMPPPRATDDSSLCSPTALAKRRKAPPDRRRRRQSMPANAKALRMLGADREALERSKALRVLGISHEEFAIAGRFFPTSPSTDSRHLSEGDVARKSVSKSVEGERKEKVPGRVADRSKVRTRDIERENGRRGMPSLPFIHSVNFTEGPSGTDTALAPLMCAPPIRGVHTHTHTHSLSLPPPS